MIFHGYIIVRKAFGQIVQGTNCIQKEHALYYFITDMGSEAYQSIFDLLELDKQLMQNTTMDKSLPLTIRRFSEPRINAILELRVNIEDEIISWIQLVSTQEGGVKDVTKLDEAFDHTLSQRGLIDVSLSSESAA